MNKSQRNTKEWWEQNRKERRIEAAQKRLANAAWFLIWVMLIWTICFYNLKF